MRKNRGVVGEKKDITGVNPRIFSNRYASSVCVSWNDATAYTNWLSEQTGHTYRLPTEAQWEYAARAGTETKYWWGNEVGSNKANCGSDCGDNVIKYTAPVGSFAANPFGLYDTAGKCDTFS
jgi:formylglycine-generating enzyme required for sulfatase activity